MACASTDSAGWRPLQRSYNSGQDETTDRSHLKLGVLQVLISKRAMQAHLATAVEEVVVRALIQQ